MKKINKVYLMAMVIAIFTGMNQICMSQNPTVYPSGLGFVTNKGQLYGTDTVQHPERYYYGNAGGSTLFLSDSIFSYVCAHADTDTTISTSVDIYYRIDTLHRFDMRLNRINNDFDIIAADTSQGYCNYFKGDSSWVHALTYQKVKYENIYSNIDLSFYSEDQFWFNISSSGNPGSIEFYYQGTDSVKLDAQDVLNIYTPYGDKKYIAKAYEYRSGTWYEFSVDFHKSDSIVSFSLGSHTSGVPLLIKVMAPVVSESISPRPDNLKWSTFYGSSSLNPNPILTPIKETFFDVFIDNNNYVYAIAATTGVDFPIDLGTNPLQPNNANMNNTVNDVFLVKFRPDRSRAVTTYYGGTSNDIPTAIIVDGSGNMIFTGQTFSGPVSIPFPQCATCGGTGAYNQAYNNGGTNAGLYDGFVVKLDYTGQSVLMSTFYGGEGNDLPHSVVVDNSGNIIIAGGCSDDVPVPSTQPANSFVQAYHDNVAFDGQEDGFIAKFNGSTNALMWATCLGGDNLAGTHPSEFIYSISIDASGNLYALGLTASDDVSCPPPCSTNSGTQYLPICDPSTATTEYVVGNSGGNDNFICKFNTSYQIVWSTMFGGNEHEGSGTVAPFDNWDPRALAVSPFDGAIYITGSTSSDQTGTAFPLLDPGVSNCKCYDATLDGTDAYIAKFNSGYELKWSTYYGGNGTDAGQALTFYYEGSLWVGGTTASSNASISFGMQSSGAYAFFDDVLGGSRDGFVLRFTDDPIRQYATYFGGDNNDNVRSISSDHAHENLVIAGYTEGVLGTNSNFPIVDFDPDPAALDFLQPAHLCTQLAQKPFISNFEIIGLPDRLGSDKDNLTNKNNRINIFPNPSGGKLFIQSNGSIISKVHITGVLGNMVRRFEKVIAPSYTCDLTALPAGMYFIETFVGDAVYRNKLIVSR